MAFQVPLIQAAEAVAVATVLWTKAKQVQAVQA
jgi:hypothetical protein